MTEMSKDPAFPFYDGDAARDVSHMNRLERGAYFDLIQAQRKFGGFTMEQARKILGKDFENVWPALDLILTKNEGGIYFIEWVKNSIENRKIYAEKQRKRIQDYWNRKKQEEITKRNAKKNKVNEPRKYRGISVDIPYENENENEKIIYNLYNNVVNFFDEDCRPKTEKQKSYWLDTLEKLIRIDGHPPDHIQNIIKRTRMDDFWRTTFLSVLKLRKKNKEGIPYFTVFEKKIQYESTIGNNKGGATPGELAKIVYDNFEAGK